MNRIGKINEILFRNLYIINKNIKHAQKNIKDYCFWGKNDVDCNYENDLVNRFCGVYLKK